MVLGVIFVIYCRSDLVWKAVDGVIHHGGDFVNDPMLMYKGGFEEILKNVAIDSFTTVGI